MKFSTCKSTKVALLFSLFTFGFAVTSPVDAAEIAPAKTKAKGLVVAQAPAKSEKGTTTTQKQQQQQQKPAQKQQQVINPNDPASIIYLDTAGKPAGLGDPTRPPSVAVQAGKGWHPQALAAQGLPKDRYGLVDWAKIVRDNIIAPKPSLDPAEEEMPPLKMDILIPAKGDFVDDVVYPHEMHTYWLKCEVCHDSKGGAIFIPAKGQNAMTMSGIVQGQWCGRCHGKVAFPLTDCKRCHTSPKKAAAK